MTIYEVIAAYPGASLLKEISIRRACIDRGVDADALYNVNMKRLTDLVIADCLVAAVNLPDFKEGDLSENLSREALLKNAESIYQKYGDGNSSKSTITARKVW